ncbi:MAG: NADP-dependent oxidoreductase, partial [Dehalococcoidia bacterium]
MPDNRLVLIASVPQGPLRVEDFEVTSGGLPAPGEGQVLCKTLAFTIGAGQRAGLQGSASYAGAPKAGVVMGGTGVARVEESNSDAFRPG